MATLMSIDEMTAFLAKVFPQVNEDFVVEQMDGERTRVRLRVTEKHLRPGGTVSGPSLFALADVSAYIATMARIGPKALAVTTSSSIDFMRKPAAATDVIAEARLLKLGRNLSVTDILLYSDGSDTPVARSTMTYSIPPK